MSEDTTFNGWTNRETWLVSLHLSNDRGLHDWAAETVESGYVQGLAAHDQLPEEYPSLGRHPAGDRHRAGVREAGDRLRQDLADRLHRAGDRPVSLLANDLLGQLFATVDWVEVADHYVADLLERVEEVGVWAPWTCRP